MLYVRERHTFAAEFQCCLFFLPSHPTRGHSPLETTLLWIAAAATTLSPPRPASSCCFLSMGHHFFLAPTAPAGGKNQTTKAKAALLCILPQYYHTSSDRNRGAMCTSKPGSPSTRSWTRFMIQWLKTSSMELQWKKVKNHQLNTSFVRTVFSQNAAGHFLKEISLTHFTS